MRANKRMIALSIFGALVLLMFLTILILRYSFRPISDAEKVRRARKLIDSVGGADKIYKEAQEILLRFGTSSERELSQKDLENFPGIESMGIRRVIHQGFSYHPGFPGYLSIQTAGHFDGYHIDIIDTSNGQYLIDTANRIELIKSCFYVH